MLTAQVRVVEAEKMNSRTALDSARDQLAIVTEQHSRARQHLTELEVRHYRLSILFSAVGQFELNIWRIFLL